MLSDIMPDRECGRTGKRVVLVGGNGAMGRLFVGNFISWGYEVRVLEKDDWANSQRLLHNAEAVIVSVPISATLEVIEALPLLPDSCILADFTSVKQAPLEAMLAKHKGPVIGLHPMFGPGVNSFSKYKMIYCEGRQTAECLWLLNQFEQWGMQLLAMPPLEHDKNMALIQGVRHFLHFILGAFMRQSNFDAALLLDMASPSFYIDMTQVGRLFGQSGQLCIDIISSEKSLALLDDFYEHMGAVLALFKNYDKQRLLQLFNDTGVWLGSTGDELKQKSNNLERFMHQ